MRQRVLEARRRDSGFTLIELLIVIVILGVLAAVVVLAVGAFNDRGEAAACKSDVKAVEVAVEAYRAKNNKYPDSLEKLVNDPDHPGENYLRSLPETGKSDGSAYYVHYDPATGAVSGFFHKGTDDVNDDELCAGGSATAPPGGGGPGGEEAPGAVTGLSVGSITQTSASISWSAPSGGVTPTGYVVRWANNPSFSGASEQTDDASPFPLTGLSPGTTYYVRVAAVNGNVEGPFAQTDFTTTTPPPSQPSAPTNVSVGSINCVNQPGTHNDPCTAVATWNASTSGWPTPGYQWQVDGNSGSSTCNNSDFGSPYVDSGDGSALSASIDGLIDGRNYCFRVRATNSAGESNWQYVAFSTPSI